jgi:hypothetical protein
MLDSDLHNANSNIKESLQLFRQNEKYLTMVVTNADSSGGRNREHTLVMLSQYTH